MSHDPLGSVDGCKGVKESPCRDAGQSDLPTFPVGMTACRGAGAFGKVALKAWGFPAHCVHPSENRPTPEPYPDNRFLANLLNDATPEKVPPFPRRSSEQGHRSCLGPVAERAQPGAFPSMCSTRACGTASEASMDSGTRFFVSMRSRGGRNARHGSHPDNSTSTTEVPPTGAGRAGGTTFPGRFCQTGLSTRA